MPRELIMSAFFVVRVLVVRCYHFVVVVVFEVERVRKGIILDLLVS